MQKMMENQSDSTEIEVWLLAVTAQALEVEDGHPAIFEPKQALLLQPLQALVGVLPRDA
jgi:hypothetical protein